MNESSIYFFAGGGHDHDGENSSLIDTNVYSIFDFGWEIFGDPNRQNRQVLNYNGFRQFVVDTVNQSIIQPAGVVFQEGVINGNAHIISGSITSNEIAANTITANNILAGTITADLLSANIVLVNTVISSNNFDGTISSNGIITGIGTVGWAITWAGDAVFDSSVIRGAIQADSLFIDGNNYWNSDEIVIGGQGDGIDTANGYVYIGSDVEVSGNVQVSNIAINNNNYWYSGVFAVGDGDENSMVFANGVLNISGIVAATAGSIGGWLIVNGNLVGTDSNNNSTITISAADGGIIESDTGKLKIVNDDIFAEDVTATNQMRVGSTNVNDAIDLKRQGVFYTDTAVWKQRGNYGWSFTWDATNSKVYAHLYDENLDTYTDICIDICGASPTPTPVNPTPVNPTPVEPTSPTSPTSPTPSLAYASFCENGQCIQFGGGAFNNCTDLTNFILANYTNPTNITCQIGSQPACPNCSSPTPVPVPVPATPLAYASFCDGGSCVQLGGGGFTTCSGGGANDLNAFILANYVNPTNITCQLNTQPACPNCGGSPTPTPVAPTPVAPTPVAPTPVAPTPVAPTPVEPTPVAPTPVAPTPVAPTPVNPCCDNCNTSCINQGYAGGSCDPQDCICNCFA